jgi:hypothetical protein
MEKPVALEMSSSLTGIARLTTSRIAGACTESLSQQSISVIVIENVFYVKSNLSPEAVCYNSARLTIYPPRVYSKS